MACTVLSSALALPALNTRQSSQVGSTCAPAASSPVLASLRPPHSRTRRKLPYTVRQPFHVCATSKGPKDSEEKAPGWAQPGSDELPPWARGEKAKASDASTELPFPVYLVGSALVSIAAVGSIFEFFNKNPIFGLVYPDSPLWIPILAFFALTGFPSAEVKKTGAKNEMCVTMDAFLFYKAITGANKASESADREDGFL